MSTTPAECSSFQHEIYIHVPDAFLLEALEGFENNNQRITDDQRQPRMWPFTKHVTDYKTELHKISVVPKKTMDETKNCVKIFKWLKAAATRRVAIPLLKQLSNKELERHSSSIILQVRKQHGSCYFSNTLIYSVAGLMRYMLLCTGARMDCTT